MAKSDLILAAAVGLGFVLGGNAIRDFERRAASEIRSKLEGDSIQVQVTSKPNGLIGPLFGDFESATICASKFRAKELPLFTEPERNASGIVGELVLELSEFRLGDLDVESLSARIPDCRFDLPLARKQKTIRLSRSGTGQGSVVVSEAALERFVLAKFKEIRTVKIRCDRGWLWVEGFGEFLIIETEFRVLAKVVSNDGTKLMLERARIAFDGLPADPAVAQALLETLNPIVDLDADLRLHGAVSVQEVTTEGGKLVAKGVTRIPVRKG